MNAGPIVARIVSDAALDRISRNRVELVAVVESLHRRGVGIASLAPSESWLQPLGAHPTEVERMIGEIILRVMAWAAQAELDSIKRRIEAGVRRAAEEGRFPGRPKALTPDQTATIRLLRRNGQSQSAVARTFGVSRQTVWRAEAVLGTRRTVILLRPAWYRTWWPIRRCILRCRLQRVIGPPGRDPRGLTSDRSRTFIPWSRRSHNAFAVSIRGTGWGQSRPPPRDLR